jgi:hypothetical protein
MRHFSFRDALFCVALSLAAAAFQTPAAAAGAGGAKVFDHVYLIVLENHDFDDALDRELSPFLVELSRGQGLATHYSGVTHPSLPNYLAMIGGDAFGVRDKKPTEPCETQLPYLSRDQKPSNPLL